MTLVTLTGMQGPVWTPDAATFRQIKGFSDAITACGFVRTADTGQIDWATVTYAGNANGTLGYEIWRFADDQQAAAPIFFKVSYGFGAIAMYVRYDLQVGTGTDGAGNLTGQVTTNRTWFTNNSSSASGPGAVSGDGSRLALHINRQSPGASNPPGGFVIERLRTPSGAQTDHFAVIQFRGFGREVYSQYVPRVGPINIEQSLPAALPPGMSSSLINGADNEVALAPSLPFLNGRMCAPLRSVLTYYNGDIAFGTPFSVTMETVTSVFMPLGSLFYASRPIATPTAQNHPEAALALRYD